MKIGIDLSMLVYTGSGVATYTYNLAKGLLKYAPEHEYKFFYSSCRRPSSFFYLDDLRTLGADITELRLPTSAIRFIWNTHSVIPVEALIGKVDIFHSSDYLRPPLLKGTKGITTIHDLTWKLFPEYHTKDVIRHHEKKLERTVKYNDTIVADSQNTKKDLLRLYPQIDPLRVHVIHLGIDDKFKPCKDNKRIEKVLKKYLNSQFSILNIKYILYVGAIEPRKNLDTAIKIFAELIKDDTYKDYLFLIAGRTGWKNENIFRLVRDLDLKKKVIFMGFVDDSDLATMYSGASAFVYLSLYEGFGLPPLEAAKCGTPSLIYKNSSLAETFPGHYPFAKIANELQTLKIILGEKSSIDLSFTKKYTWQNYIYQFLNLF